MGRVNQIAPAPDFPCAFRAQACDLAGFGFGFGTRPAALHGVSETWTGAAWTAGLAQENGSAVVFDKTLKSLVLAAGLGIAAIALAGCEEIVDFSGRPMEKLQTGTAEAGNSAILVAETVDVAELADALPGLVPADLTGLGKRVKKAQCRTSDGEQLCRSASLKGAITRDGSITLAGTPAGITVTVPLRADLTAQLEGAKDSQPEQISGRFTVVATYKAQFDEAWHVSFELGKDLAWSEPATVPVFDVETSIESEVLDELLPKLRRFSGRLEDALQPRNLRALTASAWRALHAPIQIASGPDIWLSGEPREVHFGGFAARGSGLEIRAVIATRLRTVINTRPKPLWPTEQPDLNAAPTRAIGGIVLPIDIGYEDLRVAVKKRLMHGLAIPPVAGEVALTMAVKDVTLYPVGTRLGVGLDLSVKVPGLWRSLRGFAHFLATPVVEPGGNRLTLSRAELIDPSVVPDQYKRDLAPLTRREFADVIAKAMDFDLGQPLERAMLLVNSASDRTIGDGLHLKGKLTDWRVGTIETTRSGLRLNAEFIGDLAVREELGAVSAEVVPAAGTALP